MKQNNRAGKNNGLTALGFPQQVSPGKLHLGRGLFGCLGRLLGHPGGLGGRLVGCEGGSGETEDESEADGDAGDFLHVFISP